MTDGDLLETLVDNVNTFACQGRDCGHTFQPEHSDAKRFTRYCSRACETGTAAAADGVDSRARLIVNGGSRRTVHGFKYWWLKYVTAFDPRYHCARCLVGTYSKRVNLEARIGADHEVVLDEARARAYYLCGNTGNWPDNFHVAFERAPGEQILKPTFNGFLVEITNARELPIPPLPAGWRGFPEKFTTCRNFQWAVHYFDAAERCDPRARRW